jgi:phytoene dehydrogenase-like protein
MLKEYQDKHDVIIVGGGLAGLAAGAYLARAGRQVTILEKGRRPGGRAQTRERDGYFFNLGPHALFAGGPGASVLRELGVPFSGTTPPPRRIHLELAQQFYGLPGDVPTLLKTRALSFSEKMTFARLMTQLPKVEPDSIAALSAQEWVEQLTSSPRLRQLMLTLIRVASYVTGSRELSAAVALEQLQLVLGDNVRYLDGGWQTLVDGLRRQVEGAGGRIESGIRVTTISEEMDGVSLWLAGGRRLEAAAAVLAVSPLAAQRLLPANGYLQMVAASAVPVRVAALDIALRRLPRPERAVVFGLDRPIYFSAHSEFGHLAPPGGAVVHLLRYLDSHESGGKEREEELLDFMDRVQPGWRDELVTRRFLREITVVHWLAGRGGLASRPGVRLPGSDRLVLAGDWVGAEGWLADGSLASGREAAQHVLQHVHQERFEPVYA